MNISILVTILTLVYLEFVALLAFYMVIHPDSEFKFPRDIPTVLKIVFL